jgi:hypothetical protein
VATTVVYAGTDDVYVQSSDPVYATAREGGVLVELGLAGGNVLYVGQALAVSYFINEALLNFDTSWLDPEVPLGAVLELFHHAGGEGRVVRAATTASVPPYDIADFIPGSALPAAQASVVVSAIQKYELFDDLSLAGSINPTGLTSLIVFSQEHQDGVAPIGGEEAFFYSASEAGTSRDPKLTVYTADLPGDEPGDTYSVVHPPIRND